MTDVFISYAHPDKVAARSLAQEFVERGFQVWWDTELLASDDFQEEILAALTQAKSVVVIWSKASVKSLFVRDEARFALHHDKLIAVRFPDVSILDIPFGFQSQHTELVDSADRIVKAVIKLGGRLPTADQPISDPSIAKEILPASSTALVMPSNKLTSFLSGIFLTLPQFQLSSHGNWNALGIATAVFLIVFGGFNAFLAMADSLLGFFGFAGLEGIDLFVYISTMLSVCALSVFYSRFGRFLDQRLTGAAWIMAIGATLFAYLTGVGIVGSFVFATNQPDFGYYLFSPEWVFGGLVMTLIVFTRMFLKARSLR